MIQNQGIYLSVLLACLLSVQGFLFADTSIETLEIQPFERIGVEESHEQVFRQVLSSELSSSYKVMADQDEAGISSAQVSGSLSALGDKIIIMMQVRNTKDGSLLFNERVNARSVDELDVIAERLAQAYLQKENFEQSVTVDNVTAQESAKKPLKSLLHGSIFQLAYFSPSGSNNYGIGREGVGVMFGSIIEQENFFYKPSMGLRAGNYNDYLEMPVDIAVGKLFRNAGITPFVSGGLGLRYMKEEIRVTSTSGGAVVKTVNQIFEEDEVGVGGHVEVGVIFLREYAYRLVTSLRYDVSNTDPFDRGNYESYSLQLGLIAF